MHLLLRALRWRAATSVVTALLAAMTVVGAVVGPLWTRAGAESVLRDTLLEAPASENAALAEAHGVPSTAALAVLDRAVGAQPLARHGLSVRGLRLLSDVTVPGQRPGYRSPLLWREGFCAQVTIVRGRCPRAAGEVLVHRQTALRLGRLGVLAGRVQGDRSKIPNLAVRVVAVGSYLAKDPSSPYWVGEEASFLSYPSGDEFLPDRVPAVLTVPETFDAIAAAHPRGEAPSGFATSTRLLDVPGIRLAQVAELRRDVAAAQGALAARSSSALVLELRDDLPYQLDRAASDGSRLGRASGLVVGQLVLLGAIVLLLTVAASAAARAPEVAAGRLRGLPTRTVVGLAVAEPLVLVLVGAPLGGLLAWVVVRAMAATALVPGTPVAVPRSAITALVGVLVVLVSAVVLVSSRSLAKPVLELWQRTSRPASPTALGRDAVALAGAAAATVLCLRAGSPWVLIASVPLLLGAALLSVRLLPVAFAPSLRRTRAGRRFGGFLAARQLVRRRESAWLLGMLVVAFGLAVSATSAWSVAGRAAAVRAATEVGATQVLVVQPDATHPELDLRAAVRRADPTGAQAMAVLEYLPFAGEPGGRLLAVDSTRLAAVAHWDTSVVGASVADVTSGLQSAGGTVPPAVVTRAVSRDPEVARRSVVTGTDGRPHEVRVLRVVRALPRVVANGSLVDLDAMSSVPLTRLAALQEVWLATPDPALVRRLIREGMTVVSVDDERARRDVLARQGPALAVLLSLVAAGLALLVAATTTLFSVLTSARRRGWELAALLAIGVPAAALRRGSRLETALLLTAGLGLGALAGVAACVLTLPRVPLFSDDGGGVTVPSAPHLLPLLVLAALAVVVTAATSLLVARVLLRSAETSRLREVQA